jgi:hypothetical protein
MAQSLNITKTQIFMLKTNIKISCADAVYDALRKPTTYYIVLIFLK